ncbi:cytochrome P450 [Lentinula boryana]|uniref:Cytochrome P450 n=1 Tax=Lentinula boryana TaxID=40481 RepID=A0ABQ8QBH2_9AGAR|nr:cytochrome P450 [Lentinula boryana]
MDHHSQASSISTLNLILISTLTLGILVLWTYRNRGSRKNLPLPPGPKKLPLLGNSLDMPSTFHWITFSKWGDQFNSDILHLKVAGVDYIILNSYEAITDLLDKRSSIYSSRPHVTMLQDLWDRDLLLLPYGEDFKAHRRLFQQGEYRESSGRTLNPGADLLLETPDEWLAHIKHMTSTVILAVAYGIHVQPKNDPNIAAAEEMIKVLNIAGIPGAFLVDVFPILKYIPYWFPGASFQRKAREWNGILSATITPPFMKVKQEMANGIAEDSFSLRCLQNTKNPDPRPDRLSKEEEVIKETVGTMYEGGADTGNTALRTFLVAMMCFPHVQLEAQEELDRVVGKGRLPDYEDLDDKDSLPYLHAVIFECMRWQPIVPLAFPHQVDSDDTYKGYFIPKGATVMPNVWAILQDEKTYGPNANTFEPKRWLSRTSNRQGEGEVWKINPEKRDPTTVAFGFGRRVCPGKHMALSSLRISVASLLHSFNITSPVVDPHRESVSVMPNIEYISGVLNYPAPFQCTIKPRSEQHVTVVQHALLDLGIEN